MKKIARLIINLILISIFVFSGYKVFSKLMDYKKADDVYSSIQDLKNDDDNSSNKITDFSKLNEDYAGWIKIDKTNIDYPVVQGEDNDFYLTHDFNKDYLASGSIFLDYRNEFLENKNSIIYGHHMRNKTMFGQLLDFKEEDFFKENRFIDISDKDGNEYRFEIFSVYVVDGEFNYIIPSFDSDEEYQKYIDGCIDRSLFNTDVDMSIDDKMITLSTCSYEFDNARTVVHGRLIK